MIAFTNLLWADGRVGNPSAYEGNARIGKKVRYETTPEELE